MKKIMIIFALSILFWIGCTKESYIAPPEEKKVTRSIVGDIQSNPDLNSISPFGGALTSGTLTPIGTVHGKVVFTSYVQVSATEFSLTSEDIIYALNSDELWTEARYEYYYPTDGSTTAVLTGYAKIVGGTGIFSNATGSFRYENMVSNIITGQTSYKLRGEITY